MPYALSILDKSPLADGESASDALKRTVELAQLSERLGYKRFWVAEHHNEQELASSAPEVLIAYLLARTSRISIGSGGVMLQHYSPYKIAETFHLLAALEPGRVDLGVGKAPGGLPLSTRALQAYRDTTHKPKFTEQFLELDAYLNGAGPVEGLRVTPEPLEPPARFLLGASVESARLAAAHRWQFVFARHLTGDDVALDEAVSAYRNVAGRAPIIAVSFIISERGDEAEAEARKIVLFKVHVPGAQSVTVGSEEQARDYARQLGSSEYRVEERKSSVIAGTPAQVHGELDRLHSLYGIEEFIVEPAVDGEQRLATISLLARAHSAAAPFQLHGAFV